MSVPSQLSVAGRVEHLFETIRNPKTGEPYTNAEVMHMSSGVLAEEDVEGVRSGRFADPSMSQIAALAAAFEVHEAHSKVEGQPSLTKAYCCGVLGDG